MDPPADKERMCNLEKIIEGLDSRKKLQEERAQILDILEKDGQKVIHEEPQIFMKMVQKAWFLMVSPAYQEIVQKMAEIYKTIINKPDEGPLSSFVPQVHFIANLETMADGNPEANPGQLKHQIEEFYQEEFLNCQRNLLSLAQMLLLTDNSVYARTELLGAVILNAKYTSKQGKFQWTEQLIDLLKILLKDGADPTCSLKELLSLPTNMEESYRSSVMFCLLKSIFLIIGHDGLVSEVKELVRILLTENCLNHREPRGSLLHALISCDWASLPTTLTDDKVKQYEEIISEVVAASTALIDVPNSDGKNPLQHFVCGITEHHQMLKIAINITPVLRSEKSLNATDQNGRTALHVLQAKITKINNETFQVVTGYLRSPTNIDMQDKMGLTPLHTLLKHISEVDAEVVLEVNTGLRSPVNVNLQDENGQTVLHTLAENFVKIGPAAFEQLVHCLRSTENVEIQDKNGATVLHLISKAIFSHPEIGKDLLRVLPSITTTTNVTSLDNDSKTPLAWILSAKSKWKGSGIDTNKVLSEIEDIFLSEIATTNSASAEHTQHRVPEQQECAALPEDNCDDQNAIYSEMKDLTKNLGKAEDLDQARKDRILQLLETSGAWILQTDPSVFFNLIKKAHYMIESEGYSLVIQKMMAIYESIDSTPKEDPLKYVVPQIEHHAASLCKDQTKFLSLIKLMIESDCSVHSRSKCLRALVINAHLGYPIQWTEEFISTLKLLLDKGAHPLWLPEEYFKLKTSYHHTAQHVFVTILINFLAQKNDFVTPLVELLPMFISRLPNCEKLESSILHSLVSLYWKYISEQLSKLPADFFKQYIGIISKVIQLEPSLTDMVDWCGRTPLQLLIHSVNLKEEILQSFIEIAQHLKSEINVCKKDHEGMTILHYLADAFPKFRKTESQKTQEAFCAVFKHMACPQNTDIQDKAGLTPLHILAETYNKKVQDHEMFTELFKSIVTDSNIDVGDNKGRTILHIFAGKFCNEVFDRNLLHISSDEFPWEVLENVNTALSSVMDLLASRSKSVVQDDEGRTFLHIMAQNYDIDVPEYCQEVVCNLFKKLSAKSNIDAQDNQGRTVLHVLATKYPDKVTKQSQMVLIDLMKYLADNFLIDVQDKSGQTILHIISKKVFWNPHIGQDLLPLLLVLTTTKNVNFVDKDSLTPFSWILRGKAESEKSRSDALEIFTKFEEIFLQNGADSNMAMSGNPAFEQHTQEELPSVQPNHEPKTRESDEWKLVNSSQRLKTDDRHLELKEIITCLGEPKDLTRPRKERILEVLNAEENILQKGDSNVLFEMIRRAFCLMESRRYQDIIQRMTELYKDYNKPMEGPLAFLAKQIEQYPEATCKDQGILLSMVKTFAAVDESTSSRTKCLRALVMKAEISSSSENRIKWTDEFISTLKLLLQGGANPIWIPEELHQLEIYVHHSAQYQFFEMVFHVLVTNNHLFDPLMELLKLFLSVKCPHQNHQTTVLHILTSLPWKWISEQHPNLPPTIFQQYGRIISEVIDRDPAIVDATSIYGRTPLHLLFREIKLHENITQYACDLSVLFISKKNVNVQDYEGKTVLHYVAEAFLIFDKSVSPEDQKAFLSVVTKLVSSSNIVIQNKFGRTPFHTLVAKYNKRSPKHCHEMFCKLVKILACPTNIDIQDNSRQTVLHILAVKYAEEATESGQIMLLQLLKDLVLKSSNCVQDYQGCTVLHLLVGNYKQKISEKGRKLCNELLLVLASPLKADIQDTLGQTALHELAKKVYEYPDLGHLLLPLLPTLTTLQNVNIKDNNSVTPYSWILGGKLDCDVNDSNSKEIFSKYEYYLVENGADAGVARLGFPIVHATGLGRILLSVESKGELDYCGPRILNLIQEVGEIYLEFFPRMFIQMIAKANKLIESAYYNEIIMRMANIFKSVPSLLDDEPLKCLVQLMQSQKEKLFKYQENFFPLIKILMTVDDSVISRTNCLRILIFNAETTEASKLNWSNELIDILECLLKEGADPTWLPEGGDESALYNFLKKICIYAKHSNLLDALRDLLSIFLTEKCLNHREPKGGILHALVNCEWDQLEEMPNYVFELYERIVTDVIEVNPELLDMTDSQNRTPVHCYISRNTGWKSMPRILKQISSDTNINAVDDKGHTAFHLLAERVSVLGIERFSELVTDIKSPFNIEIQDKSGQTILHILARTVFWNPSSGHDLYTVFPTVTTSKNVNTIDENSVTPYSWILRGKQQSEKLGSHFGSLFSRLEEIFRTNGGDADIAKGGFPFIESLEQMKLFESLQTKEDLDSQWQNISDLLQESGNRIVETDDQILQKLVQKATNLIESSYYIPMIEKMIDISNAVLAKPEDGILQCLLQHMENVPERKRLFDNREQLLSLIEVLCNADKSLDSRTKCLWLLIEVTSYTIYEDSLWTPQFVDIIKRLLDEGADPTWRPTEMEGHDSVLLTYFLGLRSKLIYGSHPALELLPLFSNKKCLNHSEERGSILHAITDFGGKETGFVGKELFGIIPEDIIESLKGIAISAINKNPALVCLTDSEGRTALHVFAERFHNHFCDYSELSNSIGLWEKYLTIFPVLSSKQSVNQEDVSCVNIKDKHSITPYSWILATKARWQNDGEEAIKKLSEVEEVFLKNDADISLAKAGSAVVIWRWAVEELTDKTCTIDRLQKLISYTKTLTNWKSHPYTEKLNDDMKNNLTNISNPKFMHTTLEIMKVMASNPTTAEHVWKFIFPDDIKELTSSVAEILCYCAERGALPENEEQMAKLLSWTSAVNRDENLTETYLKIMLSIRNRKDFNLPNGFNFLQDFYIVKEEILKLVMQLAHDIHGTMDNCLKAENLITCLLFVSHGYEGQIVLNESLFENVSFSNWLQRSPLHLAAMFLYSTNGWKSIPQSVIEKYLNVTDVHGSTALHLAYMHKNECAIDFLVKYGASEDVVDNFEMTPNSHKISSSMVSPNAKHERLCSSIIDSRPESDFLDVVRPMVVLPEKEAEALCNELKELFERLLKETKFREAKVVIVGSMRERLKAGRFDKGDIQIRFQDIYRLEHDMMIYHIAGIKGTVGQVLAELSDDLIKSMTRISWKGIYLRPVSVKGPWQLIREGSSACKGTPISVDVVPVVERIEEEEYPHRTQQELLDGATSHKWMKFLTLDTWKEDQLKSFHDTLCIFEWDMIDSLPPSCRIAIVICKSLVQAYDWCRRGGVNMPMSSYTIKTSLFYLLAYKSSELRFDESDIESTMSALNMKLALGAVEGHVKTRTSKIKFNPCPKWTTDEDFDQFGDEAIVMARKIFTFIKYLAKEGFKVSSFWYRRRPVEELTGFGEAEYICDICNCLLNLLNGKKH